MSATTPTEPELRQAHRFLRLKSTFDQCMASQALRTCLKTVAEIQARRSEDRPSYQDNKMRAAHMERS